LWLDSYTMHNEKLKAVNWNGRTFGFDLLMINDHERNRFYQDSLNDVRNKIVLDIGAGTGLLSALAVECGASHVYSFEYDPKNYSVTENFIKQSNLQDKITLILADVLTVDNVCWEHQPIDIIITETFASDCFIENFAFLVEHVENNFNLSDNHRWIPDVIDLEVQLFDYTVQKEFNPGVAIPALFEQQIDNAVAVYRDNFYHAFNQFILPVSQLPKVPLTQPILVDRYYVNKDLRSTINAARYKIDIDLHDMTNPYLKVNWKIKSGNTALSINNAESWRSLGFKLNKNLGNSLYLKYHPLTHSLIASQV
jgi:predicted RNA methylase